MFVNPKPWRFKAVRLCLLLFALGVALDASAFQLVPSFSTNGLFRVRFPTTAGLNYILFQGMDVTDINTFAGSSLGTGTACEIVDPNPPTASKMFYRVIEGIFSSHLVINEIDYDQPGNDTASFIEIYNSTGISVSLTNLAVVLINGSTSAEYARFDLSSAGTTLSQGGYLVIKNPAVTVPPGTLAISVDNGDFIQNGAPDGVALINTAAQNVIDALSYEGSITTAQIVGFTNTVTLVEGTATTVSDPGTGVSMARLPNGQDTDNAADDWKNATTPTPGAANQP